MKTPRILFVDDEVSILNSLRRGLRLHCRDWEIKFFNSPIEALNSLSDFNPMVIVSDKRMPEMDGIDFLKQVNVQAPDVIRILLTGDTNNEIAIDSSDVVHMLASKPFKIESIIQLLKRALSLQRIPVSLSIRKQLCAIDRIPVLPKEYNQLTEYLKKDNIETKEVANIISHNPLILAKLMQLANSAFLGFSTPVYDAQHTVTRLGIDFIKNLVLFFGLFEPRNNIDNQLCEQLFTEAMEIAILSKQFSTASKQTSKEADNSFILCLLHNIGKVMSGMKIISMESDKSDITPHEDDIVGAYLLALWEFDADIVNAVLFQSIPEKSENITPLSCQLHVAKTVYHSHKLALSAFDDKAGLNCQLLKSQGVFEEVTSWISEIEL